MLGPLEIVYNMSGHERKIQQLAEASRDTIPPSKILAEDGRVGRG